MPYAFDVFLSYSRRSLIEDWVRNFFLHQLDFWLDQEFPTRKCKIFCDMNIEPGDNWSNALKDALRQSACLVAVWAPSYFKSKWCVAEFCSFLNRAAEARVTSPRLIIPVQWHDGEYFPPAAKQIQYSPFADHTYPIRDTQAFADFQLAVQQLAKSVKRAVDDAPPFRADWPVTEPSDIDELVALNPNEARQFYNFDPQVIPNPRKLGPRP